VIFITKSFGWLGCSLGSLDYDMDDDVLDVLMVLCLVYLLIIRGSTTLDHVMF
jgi:hypothetical protein